MKITYDEVIIIESIFLVLELLYSLNPIKILIFHDMFLFTYKSLVKTLCQLHHPDFIMIMALSHFPCNSVLFLLYILR